MYTCICVYFRCRVLILHLLRIKLYIKPNSAGYYRYAYKQ